MLMSDSHRKRHILNLWILWNQYRTIQMKIDFRKNRFLNPALVFKPSSGSRHSACLMQQTKCPNQAKSANEFGLPHRSHGILFSMQSPTRPFHYTDALMPFAAKAMLHQCYCYHCESHTHSPVGSELTFSEAFIVTPHSLLCWASCQILDTKYPSLNNPIHRSCLTELGSNNFNSHVLSVLVLAGVAII